MNFDAFYLISQIFALAATILSLYAFQRRKKVQILNYTVVAALCSVFHYLFLGGWSGAATKAVGVVRNIVAAYETHRWKDGAHKREDKTHKRKALKLIPFAFVAFYVIAGVFTYQSPISLLPVLAASAYTLGIYFCDAQRLRYVAIATSGLWLIYGACVFSIVGVVAEAIFIVNDLLAIRRYREKDSRVVREHREKQQVNRSHENRRKSAEPRTGRGPKIVL